MFVKPLHYPLVIAQLETLKKRCSNLDLEDLITSFKIGFAGEKAIAYYLQSNYFSEVKIFHDVRLKWKNQYCQIDFLLLTPNFVLLLECKNIHGTLTLEEVNGQLIKKDKKYEKGFINPMEQVQKQADLFSLFLQDKGFSFIPIHTNVVIAQPSTVLKIASSEDAKKFIHGYQLEGHMKKLMLQYPQPVYHSKNVNHLSKVIMDSIRPFSMNWRKRFSITEQNLQKGIFCSYCKQFNMDFYYGKCICPHCTNSNPLAAVGALEDYYYLFGEFISTATCKDWLGIQSDRITRRLLKEYSMSYIGSTKKKVYRLDKVKLLRDSKYLYRY